MLKVNGTYGVIMVLDMYLCTSICDHIPHQSITAVFASHCYSYLRLLRCTGPVSLSYTFFTRNTNNTHYCPYICYNISTQPYLLVIVCFVSILSIRLTSVLAVYFSNFIGTQG